MPTDLKRTIKVIETQQTIEAEINAMNKRIQSANRAILGCLYGLTLIVSGVIAVSVWWIM